jgi:hypothetical protein
MATYEGMGLCDKDEYQAAFDARLLYHQLRKGELYVALFDIEAHEKAYRIVGRVGLLASDWGGIGKLEFQLLNDHLQPLKDIRPSATMRDGRLNMDLGITYPDPDRGSMAMHDAYLAQHEDHTYDLLLEAMAKSTGVMEK